MKKPNFFIIGAPKCGTSSLCKYLGEHPNIFIPHIKEPHYFIDDLPASKIVRNLDQYLNLFKNANEIHKAVGEGTVKYMYSPAALKNIREFDTNAKIIIMLRNPAHMVVSLHQQLFHGLFEDEKDFRKAWNLQNARLNGEKIPKHCRLPEWLIYGRMGSYSEYVERVLAIFPRTNVKVIIFDDFCKNTEDVFNEVLDFLGVGRSGKINFDIFNSQKDFSSKLAQIVAQKTPLFIRNIVTRMRISRYMFWIPNLIDFIFKHEVRNRSTFNSIQDEAFKKELVDYFRGDVKRLSVILDRDLTEIWGY